MAPPLIMGYWDIRGLAQPIRLLLEYTGVDWEDKLYRCGPPPELDRSSWLDEKETLGLDFPNLPYLIDGKLRLSQTEAILRYIARKFKLEGQTDEEKTRVDLILAETADLRRAYSELVYNPSFETLKDGYLKTLSVKLERVSKFLGDRDFFCGKNLTFADFVVYEILDVNKAVNPDCLKKHKNLEGFQQRIEKLDRISSYVKSPRFIKSPLNFITATFGAS